MENAAPLKMEVDVMFNKLNYAEKAQLFNGISVLENKYGKEKTQRGLESMLEVLEGKEEQKPHQELHNQMELEMEIGSENQVEPAKLKRRPIFKDEAERVAVDLGYKSLNDLLIEKYYKQEKRQRDIAELFGCNQRTISTWINEIPKSQLKRNLD